MAVAPAVGVEGYLGDGLQPPGRTRGVCVMGVGRGGSGLQHTRALKGATTGKQPHHNPTTPTHRTNRKQSGVGFSTHLSTGDFSALGDRPRMQFGN